MIGPLSGSLTFTVSHKEGLVLAVVDLRNYDWPANHETELVLPQRGNTRLEKTACIIEVISVELEKRTVKVVTAALADDIDLIRAEAVLGGICGGLLFELLDCVYRQYDCRRVQGRVC